jgi:hypothetical protein
VRDSAGIDDIIDSAGIDDIIDSAGIDDIIYSPFCCVDCNREFQTREELEEHVIKN